MVLERAEKKETIEARRPGEGGAWVRAHDMIVGVRPVIGVIHIEPGLESDPSIRESRGWRVKVGRGSVGLNEVQVAADKGWPGTTKALTTAVFAAKSLPDLR